MLREEKENSKNHKKTKTYIPTYKNKDERRKDCRDSGHSTSQTYKCHTIIRLFCF